MNYNGKHVKNNPKFLNLKGYIASGIVALGTVTGVYMLKNNEEVEASNIEPSVVTSMLKDYGDVILESGYGTNEYLITSGILNYFRLNNIKEEDKLSILNNPDYHDDIKKYVLSYIDNYYITNNYSFIKKSDLNLDSYYSSLNYIKSIEKYASLYDIPVSILVGLLSSNCNTDKSDIHTIGTWNEINEDTYAYNFKTQSFDNLMDYKDPKSIDESIRYIAMAFRVCLDKANGNLYNENSLQLDNYDAIDYFIDRKINLKDKNLTIGVRKRYSDSKSIILNSVMMYSKTNPTLLYVYDKEGTYNNSNTLEYRKYDLAYDDYIRSTEDNYDLIMNYMNYCFNQEMSNKSK